MQGRGAWSVILTIDSVQKSDTEKEYILEARNGEGAYEYRIILSTATEPAGKAIERPLSHGLRFDIIVKIRLISHCAQE